MQSISIQPNHIYHLYNRGVNREPIFFQEKNWNYFLHKMFYYFNPPKAEIIAYCLMPNHYHILVNVLHDNFGVKVMMPFITSYTKAINLQENRVGPIFQGSYKYKLIEAGETLIQVSRYIHLNPVTAGLVNQPADWEYSSYRDYLGARNSTPIKKEMVLDYFLTIEQYQNYVEES